jgi:hypothetical protein
MFLLIHTFKNLFILYLLYAWHYKNIGDPTEKTESMTFANLVLLVGADREEPN